LLPGSSQRNVNRRGYGGALALSPIAGEVDDEACRRSDNRTDEGVAEGGQRASGYRTEEETDSGAQYQHADKSLIVVLFNSVRAHASSADTSWSRWESRAALRAGSCVWRDGISAVVAVDRFHQRT
jgi:hypothetical protein